MPTGSRTGAGDPCPHDTKFVSVLSVVITMKSFQIKPDPSSRFETVASTPISVPTGATFPDGTPFTAYRVHLTLFVGDTKQRIYGFRLGNILAIFTRADEEATTAAVIDTAIVSPGIELPERNHQSAYMLLHAEGGNSNA